MYSLCFFIPFLSLKINQNNLFQHLSSLSLCSFLSYFPSVLMEIWSKINFNNQFYFIDFILLFFLIFTWGFSQQWEESKRKTKKTTTWMWERRIDWLPPVCPQGELNPKPRYMIWPGIEPTLLVDRRVLQLTVPPG